MMLRTRHMTHIRRPIVAMAACAMMILGTAVSACAQVPLPVPRHEPPAPYCLSMVRYFGVGSFTLRYPLVRQVGQFRYRVPRHALPLIIAQTGTMRDMAFFDSQLGQEGMFLASGPCRFLNHHNEIEHLTITGQHGRRIGLIVAQLVRPGSTAGEVAR